MQELHEKSHAQHKHIFSMKLRYVVATAALSSASVLAFGQQPVLTDAQINAAGPSKLMFAAIGNEACDAASQLAEKDIANNLLFLCLSGGIAPIAIMPADKQFEQKFQVHYYEYGCSSPEQVCMVMYNKRVFAYLSGKYGNGWMKRVRKDVVGFKEWKAGR